MIKLIKLSILVIGKKECVLNPRDICAANISVANFNVDIDCYISTQCKCLHSQDAINQFHSIEPYLYPFEIEFNILVGMESFQKGL